jgi:hypothetical protein
MVKPGFESLEAAAVTPDAVRYNPSLATIIKDRQTGEAVPVMTAADFVGFTRKDGIHASNAVNCFYAILRALASEDETRYCAVSPDYAPENRNSQLGLRVAAAPDIMRHIQDDDFLSRQRNFSEQSFLYFVRYVDSLLSPPATTRQ